MLSCPTPYAQAFVAKNGSNVTDDADYGFRPLHWAVGSSNTPALDALLDVGEARHVSAPSALRSPPRHDPCLAFQHGHGLLATACLLYVWHAGADVNAVDRDGRTPLYHATKDPMFTDMQGLHFVQRLLGHGACPNIVGHDGETKACSQV